MSPDVEVVEEPEARRFVVRADGEEAELVYRRRGDRLAILHTGVPAAIGGRGIAGRLVAAAVERAREEDLTVVPYCSYAHRWLEQHPGEAATVRIEWPDQPAPAPAPTDRPG
ncbi:MAG: GNAT family N-acetyltransferase [Acidimicrobiales bacterium]